MIIDLCPTTYNVQVVFLLLTIYSMCVDIREF